MKFDGLKYLFEFYSAMISSLLLESTSFSIQSLLGFVNSEVLSPNWKSVFDEFKIVHFKDKVLLRFSLIQLNFIQPNYLIKYFNLSKFVNNNSTDLNLYFII